MVVVRS
ncbi:Protein of unknown function [Pyronema omphalodes CBS 100304]|nr:Protein of unknown function [Pyronema omphalodes CBS 100304]